MISIGLKGRFGNHLFQYCVGRILADRNNTTFCIPNEGIYRNLPNEDLTFLGNKVFKNCYLGNKFIKQKKIFKETNSGYDDRFLSISDVYHIDGFFQSEKYFKGYEDKIREWLVPDYREVDGNVCIIHFRAQDGYLKQNFVLPKEFFDKAKDVIREKNPNIKFVIITDNPALSKKYFGEDEIMMNDMKTDFEYIYHSKYKIISNSSFSWWAAWLNLPNSEIVIAPNRWMNYNYNKYKEDKFYPRDIKTKGFIYI